jgi:multiple sugar transport system permease protein
MRVSMEPRKKPSRFLKLWRQYSPSYILVAPYFAVFTVFVLFAVLQAVYQSFTYYNIIQPASWVGLENYINLFTSDPVFWKATKNTLVYSIVVGPLGFWISLVVAWLINEVRVRKLFTFTFYIPSISSGVALGVIWKYIFGGSRLSLLNYVLTATGVINSPIQWLSDVRTQLVSVMVVSIWMSLGTMFLVFIAALQGLPDDVFESAAIDGAGKWKQFWRITLPLMKPALLFGAVNAVVNSFQVFDLIMALVGFPSLGYAAHTIVAHMYDYGFVRLEMGYASAVAVVLFILTITLSQALMRLLRSRDLY